ncbi:unnamed protein product [Urochloa decumbens]|uniref:Ripening-related protein 1 n=1 Tax=Urochloa decumbens TaxID=240449 RepID=A0ABC8XW73_9POAL
MGMATMWVRGTRALCAAVPLLLLMILHKHVPAQAAFPYRSLLQTCQPSGSIPGRSGDCNPENGSECCKDGQRYTTYACSPRPPHAQQLRRGRRRRRSRCRKHIVIRATSKGRTVRALVVDECDSTVGCDKEHNLEPPCRNNIVDGSPAVWDALGLNKDDGQAQITWSDE